MRDNLAMALKNARGPFSVLWTSTAAKDAERIHEFAAEIGLTPELDRIAGELSHGQKQWLETGMPLRTIRTCC